MSRRRRIKVLTVVSSLGPGGYERVVENLCRKIDPNRFEISVCCLKHIGMIGRKLHDEGFDIQTLGTRKLGLGKYIGFMELRKLIKRKKVDILHTHGRHAFIDGTLSSLCLPRVRFINTFHFGNYPHLPLRFLILEAICSRVADRLVAVSERQRESLVRTYKLDPERIITVWNGIEENDHKVDLAEVKNSLGIPCDAPVVGTIGHLTEQKGYPYFLEVCKEINLVFPEVFFFIIGGGRLEKAIKQRSEELGLRKRVIFAGVRPDATALVHAFDIFLLTSLWEAMPIVLLEAMAAGKPVVATDVGENSRIVSEGETGFILPAKDVIGMAGRIRELLVNADRRKLMGMSGRERFKRFFTSKAMADRYATLYESLLHNGRSKDR